MLAILSALKGKYLKGKVYFYHNVCGRSEISHV